MQKSGAGWRAIHHLQYHIYSIPLQNILKDKIALVYGRSFSYRPAVSRKVTVWCAVNTSSSGRESVNSDSDSTNGDDVEIENGSDCSCNSQLARFSVTDCFSND